MKRNKFLKFSLVGALSAVFLLSTGQIYATYLIQDDLVVEGDTLLQKSLNIQGNDGALFDGTYNSGSILATGQGTRFIWYPRRAALRAGRISSSGASDYWDDANIGNYSVAFGQNSKASGSNSFAAGGSSEATGNFSSAFGSGTEASGYGSEVSGLWNTASGSPSFATGESNLASGISSAAFGWLTEASGYATTSFGDDTLASGSQSTAMGLSTTASGSSSTAMGIRTIAQGHSQLVIGKYNVAQGSATSWVETDDVFIIGNGADSSNRSNAFSVKKNGDATIAGDLTVDGNIVSDINLQDNLNVSGQVRAQDRISAEVTNGQNLVTVLAANNDGANAAGTGVRMALSNSSSGLETLVRGGTIDAVRQADGSNDLIFSSGTGSALNEILRLKGTDQSTMIQGDTEINGDLTAVNGKLTHADRHSYTHRISNTKSADTLVKLGEFTMPINHRQIFIDGYVTTGTSQVFEKERFTFQFRRQGDADTYAYSFRKDEFSAHTGGSSDRVNLEFFSDDTNPTRVLVAARYKTNNHQLFAHYDVIERRGNDLYIQASQHSPEILAADAAEYSAFLNNHTLLDPTGGVRRIQGDTEMDGDVTMTGEVTIANVPPQGGISMGEFGF